MGLPEPEDLVVAAEVRCSSRLKEKASGGTR